MATAAAVDGGGRRAAGGWRQVLASACEQAILLLQPDKTTFRASGAVVSRESSSSGSVVFGSSGGAGQMANSSTVVGVHRPTHPGRLALLDYTSFELVSSSQKPVYRTKEEKWNSRRRHFGKHRNPFVLVFEGVGGYVFSRRTTQTVRV